MVVGDNPCDFITQRLKPYCPQPSPREPSGDTPTCASKGRIFARLLCGSGQNGAWHQIPGSLWCCPPQPADQPRGLPVSLTRLLCAMRSISCEAVLLKTACSAVTGDMLRESRASAKGSKLTVLFRTWSAPRVKHQPTLRARLLFGERAQLQGPMKREACN